MVIRIMTSIIYLCLVEELAYPIALDKLKDIFLLKGIVGLLKKLQRDAIILAVFATLLPVVGGIITFLTGATFEVVRAEIVAIIVFLINFPRQSVWRKIVGGMEKI